MAEFATIDPYQANIPMTISSPEQNALNLTNPNSILTGNMAGTQNASNFIVTNPVDKSKIGFGLVPGSTTNEYGFFIQDGSGNLIMKIVNGTWYVYDITNAKNIMQSGKLPDATYGWVIARSGNNVRDVYS